MQKHIILKTPPQPSFMTVVVAADGAGTTLGTEQLSPDIWSIVFAGGEGERLRALTKRWLGGHRPK